MKNEISSEQVKFYQDNGYRFARIDRNTLFTKHFSEGVYLRIHIDEGKIGGIIVTGNSRTKKNAKSTNNINTN